MLPAERRKMPKIPGTAPLLHARNDKKYYIRCNRPGRTWYPGEAKGSSILLAGAIRSDQPNNVSRDEWLRHEPTHSTAHSLLECRVCDIGANG
jgi:hypothetical protein